MRFRRTGSPGSTSAKLADATILRPALRASSRRLLQGVAVKNEPRHLGCYEGLKVEPARQSGSVMLEFVIAFPLVLVLMFACIQFSEIWIARMVVHYGAFCAARTALVCKDTEYGSPGSNSSLPAKAAIQVCSLLRQENGNMPVNRCKTTIIDNDPAWNITASQTYQFSLITPIVGQIIAWGMNPWDDNSPWATPEKTINNTDGFGYPTIELTEKVVLPKPYHTMVPSGL